jgi:mono/diheme cytochrome c family protein
MANKLVRRLGILLGVLVLLILLSGAAVYVFSGRSLNRTWAVNPPPLTIVSDSASLARGRHLVTTRLLCVDCHSADLGGQVVIDGMPFGRFVATNLTPGGAGATYSDADWVRAIRHGIRPNGKSLLFMPSDVFSKLGSEDLAAVIAYLKTVAPVSRALPPTELGPVGRMLVATNKAPLVMAEQIDHNAPIPAMPPEGETVEYGRYLVSSGGCQACHGPNLSGGKIAGGPEDPPATNITPTGIGNWTESDWFRAFREGKRPDRTDIKPFMPWKTLGGMTDSELRALYMYLQTVPARPYGEG